MVYIMENFSFNISNDSSISMYFRGFLDLLDLLLKNFLYFIFQGYAVSS